MLYQLSYARVFANGTLREFSDGTQEVFSKNEKSSRAPQSAEKIACRGMRLCVLLFPHFPWMND